MILQSLKPVALLCFVPKRQEPYKAAHLNFFFKTIGRLMLTHIKTLGGCKHR